MLKQDKLYLERAQYMLEKANQDILDVISRDELEALPLATIKKNNDANIKQLGNFIEKLNFVKIDTV